MVVQALMSEHGMSERRACQASGIARSTLRYRPVACDDSGGITFIQTHVALNPRHGFGLLYDSARHQGKPWGKTVLWRVYCEMRLNLLRRGKKRLPARIKQPLQAAGQPNQGWSCDFMSDALWSGRRFRTFNVIDEFNREGLRIEVDTSLPAARVIRVLNELVEVRGAPLSIRLENGPEFIAHALPEWAKSKGIALNHIQPGKPTQNAYVERFNNSAMESFFRSLKTERIARSCAEHEGRHVQMYSITSSASTNRRASTRRSAISVRTANSKGLGWCQRYRQQPTQPTAAHESHPDHE